MKTRPAHACPTDRQTDRQIKGPPQRAGDGQTVSAHTARRGRTDGSDTNGRARTHRTGGHGRTDTHTNGRTHARHRHEHEHEHRTRDKPTHPHPPPSDTPRKPATILNPRTGNTGTQLDPPYTAPPSPTEADNSPTCAHEHAYCRKARFARMGPQHTGQAPESRTGMSELAHHTPGRPLGTITTRHLTFFPVEGGTCTPHVPTNTRPPVPHTAKDPHKSASKGSS